VQETVFKTGEPSWSSLSTLLSAEMHLRDPGFPVCTGTKHLLLNFQCPTGKLLKVAGKSFGYKFSLDYWSYSPTWQYFS
jgi:hypothetical protein